MSPFPCFLYIPTGNSWANQGSIPPLIFQLPPEHGLEVLEKAQDAPIQQITASPLRAGIDCLRGLPDTMIINGQADVLRSEGQAFGERLRCAGVEVTALRIQGTIHDFVMLNALNQTDACRTAMDVSTDWINRKNQCPAV